jgi:hypothetical protein
MQFKGVEAAPQDCRAQNTTAAGTRRRDQEMTTRLLLPAFLVSALIAAAALSQNSSYRASAANGITNGGFEAGNTSGWAAVIPAGGFINVVNSFGGANPVEGSFFAVMKTDGPGSFTTLSQSFTASPGDRLVGSARFFDGDCAPIIDTSDVILLDSGDNVVATLFQEQSCGPDLGWLSWDHLFTAAGSYTIRARIANQSDDIFDSHLGVDAVSLILAPTPTPTASATATASPTAEPTRVRRNVGGAAAAVVGAVSDQAAENRERAAAAAPQGTVAPPRTGTGVTIAPPSTGDAGLAENRVDPGAPMLAVVAAIAGLPLLRFARR